MKMSSKFCSRIFNCIDKINGAMQWTAIFMMMGIATLICYEVFMRYMLIKPTMFSAELCQVMQVFLAMLAAGWVLREDGHVSIEILVHKLSSRWRNSITVVTSGIGVIFCGLLTWLMWLLFFSAFKARLGTAIMGWPLYMVKFVAAFGIFLLGLQFVVRAYQYYRLGKGGTEEREVKDD